MPIFWSLDLEQMLIYQDFFFMGNAILHSIKLPFDVQAAEKILHVIYSSRLWKNQCAMLVQTIYLAIFKILKEPIMLVKNQRYFKKSPNP